jgi:hypothetical protein
MKSSNLDNEEALAVLAIKSFACISSLSCEEEKLLEEFIVLF